MKHYNRNYFVLVGGLYALWLVASLVLFVTFRGNSWNWGTFLFWMGILVYTPFSIRAVQPDQLGCVVFFGKILASVNPGPALVPRLLFALKLVPGTIQEHEVPGDSKEIWSGEPEKLPPGMVLPLRISTGYKNPQEHKSPLDNQMTVEVNYYVRYEIVDAAKFISEFSNLEEFRRQIEDTSTRVVQREFGQRTLADIIANYGTLNDLLKKENEELVEDAGVKIVDVGIKHSDPSHAVNKSLAGLASSSLDAASEIKRAEGAKQSEILRGEGKKSSLQNEGEGRAAAEQALLMAQAEGFEATIKKLGLSPDQASELYKAIVAAQALEKVKDVRIISGGSNPMASMFGLITEAAADVNRNAANSVAPATPSGAKKT